MNTLSLIFSKITLSLFRLLSTYSDSNQYVQVTVFDFFFQMLAYEKKCSQKIILHQRIMESFSYDLFIAAT